MPTRAELEAEKLKAETRKIIAEAREHETKAKIAALDLKARKQDDVEFEASDWNQRIYRFTGEVDEKTVQDCVETLTLWARMDADEPGDVEVIFTSHGGDSFFGNSLYDNLRAISGQGFNVITTDLGYACSMAGILLQAGDWRRIGAQSFIHIHEVSWWHHGKFSEHEDELALSRKLVDRMIKIYVERSGKITEKKLRELIMRKEAWFSADEAIAHGFADEIV